MMTNSCNSDDSITVPKAKRNPKEIVKHGHTRIDNYYWLNDRNDPDVKNYLLEENEFLMKSLSHTENLQKKIFEEITARIEPTDESVPYFDNGYYYYHRYEEGKEFPVYARKKGVLSSPEEILLDVNETAKGYENFQIGDLSISDNNNLMAYSFDPVGNNSYVIMFKDLITGKILPDRLTETDGDCEWASDNETVYYVRKDINTLREFQLWKHRIGVDISDDILVYEERDDRYFVSLSKSKSGKYILLGSFNTVSTEFRYIKADCPTSELNLIQRREKNHEYFVETHGKELFILTNSDDSKNFKIVKTSVEFPSKENWKDVIGYENEILIEDFEVFKDYIVTYERKNGLANLRVFNLNDKSSHYIDLDEDVYEIWISDNNQYDTQLLRYEYSSLTTPTSVYDYNCVSRKKKLLKRKFAGTSFSKDNYVSRRVYVDSGSGDKIPLSLVHKKGLRMNADNPLLIYAYGAYGISIDLGFQQELLSLLDRGFIYAVAHVRGGQEMGREWYEKGRLFNKKNTFTDFISCTEYLHKKAYSKPQLTFAYGESAGGLLTGVIANSHPELYAGIISEVPFVDIVTTMLDKSLPLTTGEYDEWGDPEKKEYYDYMLSYSPYDQIKKQEYPSMLITAAYEDSQVPFWEPAKWAAKLREYNINHNQIFLYTSLETGHTGYSGRYKVFKETALIYSYILDILAEN